MPKKNSDNIKSLRLIYEQMLRKSEIRGIEKIKKKINLNEKRGQNMRETHRDFIERWAIFMRENPTKWKKIHTEFINAQFISHEQFLDRLLQQPNGKKKIRELYNIKNLEGYPRFV